MVSLVGLHMNQEAEETIGFSYRVPLAVLLDRIKFSILSSRSKSTLLAVNMLLTQVFYCLSLGHTFMTKLFALASVTIMQVLCSRWNENTIPSKSYSNIITAKVIPSL
jgi:hypothetical protein